MLDSTLVYPSGMSGVRNKMEIHLDESSMTLTELEKYLQMKKQQMKSVLQKHAKIKLLNMIICTITIVLRLALARRLFLL